MNKRQYEGNRSYRYGYDDGFDDGFGKGFRKNKSDLEECKTELIDVKTQLQEEKRINKRIQADAKKVKADAEKQSERIDDLQERVDDVLDVLNGLQTEYDSNSSDMEGIMVKRANLESENKEIDIVLNNYVDLGAIKSDFVKEQVMALKTKQESNNGEIKRGEREFSKLQKKNVGINSTINNFKVKNFDKIVEAVNTLTA